MATLGSWEKSKVHQTALKVEKLEDAAATSLHYGATANDLANFPGMMNLVAGSGVSLTPGAGTLTIAASGGGSSGHSPGCVFSNVLAATTVTSEIQIPYGGTIEGWTIVGDVAGSVSIAVSRATYANYDTMTSLFTATCTTSKKAQATGLSHSLTAGDILRFTASGFSLFNRVSITLEVN